MTRNVAVVGHLHHGKTALMDMLVFETHKLTWDSDQSVRSHIVVMRANLKQSACSFDIPTRTSCHASG